MDQAATAVGADFADAAAHRFDAVIVGTGQAGSHLASTLARGGRKVALVASAQSGSHPDDWGDSAIRSLATSARIAHTCRRAGAFGVTTGAVRVDFRAVRERASAMARRLRDIEAPWPCQAAGVTLIPGEARFRNPRTLVVREREGRCTALTAEYVFIDTGTRPGPRDVPGLEDVPYVSADTVLALEELPTHLVVLGGSAAGVECAQLFTRLGSKVTLVDKHPQLLPAEDRDVAAALAEVLRQDGVNLLLEARAVSVAANPGGGVRATLALPLGEKTLRGSHVLVAPERVPDSGSLNLQAAGIAVDENGYVRVNERLETNVRGIYALGYVKNGASFFRDGFPVARRQPPGHGQADAACRLSCCTVFTDPQLGRIGLTESEARLRYRDIRVAKSPFCKVARALDADESRGFIKAVVDGGTKQILGAAVLGVDGVETMTMMQIAMLGRLPYPVLHDSMFAHSTLAQSINDLFSTLDASEEES